jgi:hypothetical protein
MITLPSSDVDFNLDLLNVLYQIYMPLASLSETFTHYDLQSRDVLIYEPVPGKYRYVLDDYFKPKQVHPHMSLVQ